MKWVTVTERLLKMTSCKHKLLRFFLFVIFLPLIKALAEENSVKDEEPKFYR